MADEFDLLILNGLVVTAEGVREADIGIREGRIAEVTTRGRFEYAQSKKTIDAEGGYVMPGGVDAHVHLEEPALFGKGSSADTYETGPRVSDSLGEIS